MLPFRVEWTLSRPACLVDRPPHLDGLLAWAAANRALRRGEDPHAARERLPLAEHRGDGGTVWQASQVFLKKDAPPFLHAMTRKTEFDLLAIHQGNRYTGSRNVYLLGTGPLKMYDLRITLFPARQALAWGVGDIDAVRDMLADIQAIGSLRRNGWGRVESFKVVEDPLGQEYWKYRTMPDPLPGYTPVEANLRADYWDKTRRQQAWVPLNNTLPENLR